MARHFGTKFRELREKSGRSMGEVARHLKVTVPYISGVEHGRNPPPVREKLISAAAFIGVDATILLTEAARDRGSFELKAGSDKALRVGAALARGWTDLGDEKLDAILDILEREGDKLRRDRDQRGYDAGVAYSYARIEVQTTHLRKVLRLDPTASLPGRQLFESLGMYHVEHKGKLIRLSYDVDDIPCEAWTEFRDGEIVVTLSHETYAALEREEARARFTLAHEVGHAALHPALLVRRSRIPHHESAKEAVLMRSAAKTHPDYRDTEWHANGYAGALLMPARGVAKLQAEHGDGAQRMLQSTFNVSRRCSEIRWSVYSSRKGELLAVK